MRPTGGMGYRGMSHMVNRSHGQWDTWAMGPMGHGAYGQWGPWGNSVHGVWGTGV